jgi:hypothetical protein
MTNRVAWTLGVSGTLSAGLLLAACGESQGNAVQHDAAVEDGNVSDGTVLPGDGGTQTCVVDPAWTHEQMGQGMLHAIATETDDTLHFVSFSGKRATHRRRVPGEAWSAEDSTDEGIDAAFTVRMLERSGALAIATQGDNRLLERAADGTWSVEDLTGVSVGEVPGLAFDSLGGLHVTNGRGQLRVPAYAMRTIDGTWSSITLPENMTGGETTEVQEIDGEIHVCTVKYPNAVCARGSDDFAAGTTVPSSDTSRVAMAGRWLVTAGIGKGDETTLTAWRWEGGAWVQRASAVVWGFLGTIHVATDGPGDLHVASTMLPDWQNATNEDWQVRYTRFVADGSVEGGWVSCGAQSTDVAGLSGGGAVVSYGTAALPSVTFIATR